MPDEAGEIGQGLLSGEREALVEIKGRIGAKHGEGWGLGTWKSEGRSGKGEGGGGKLLDKGSASVGKGLNGVAKNGTHRGRWAKQPLRRTF